MMEWASFHNYEQAVLKAKFLEIRVAPPLPIGGGRSLWFVAVAESKWYRLLAELPEKEASHG